MKRMLKYLQPYKFYVLFLLFVLLVQSASEIALPTLLASVINLGILKNDNSAIVLITLLMLAVSVTAFLGAAGASFFSSRITSKLSANLRQRVFKKVNEFSLYEIDKFGVSSLITRTTNDISQIEHFLTFFMRAGAFAPIMAIGGTTMAIIAGKSLSFVLIAAIPVTIIFVAIMIYFGSKIFKKMQTKIDSINRVLRENLTGLKVIKAFRRTKYEINRFDEQNKDYTKISILAQRLMGGLFPVVILILNLTTIAVMYFGSSMVINATMDVGSLVAYSQYIVMILMSVMMISMIFVMYPRAVASSDRVAEVLESEILISDNVNLQNVENSNIVLENNNQNENANEIVKSQNNNKINSSNKNVSAMFLEEETKKESGTPAPLIEFKGVSFTYPNAKKPVLQNISFTAERNQTIAIIGGTGSGKSTIINLIPRFYDVTEGEILIKGRNIKELPQKDLRDKIGYVPQKGVLFSGTILENLTIGNKNATEEEIIKAAKIAQADKFVLEKEEGYNAPVSQGGKNFSGGQKQRLTIARAIVKNPEIYIFDDSFSALDFKTDAALRKALKKEIKNCTIFIVAQRISTIMNADKIIVLNEGKIEGIGTHQELMESSSFYKEIVNSQFKKGDE